MAPGRDRGPGVLGGRGRLPVRPDRPSGAPGPPGQDEAVDRLAPDADPGGGRGRCGCRRSRRTPGSTGSWSTTGGSSACRRSASARRCRYGRRRGVVLTAGGFIFNDDMLRQHCPPLVRGIVQGRHRGRRRARHPHGPGPRGVGAQHVRGRGLAPAHAAAHADPRHPGQRARPALHQRGHLHGPGGPVRPLRAGRRGLSDRGRGLLRGRTGWASPPHGSARRRRSSSPRSGCPPGSLQATLELYNRHAARGEGPALPQGRRRGCGRSCPRSAPSTCASGRRPTRRSRSGGLETTVDGGVLDLNGDAIPGLFAAGRTTSGVCSFGYASGLSIGDSTMFGRFAGASAAGASALT